jgi:hypothetical protein
MASFCFYCESRPAKLFAESSSAFSVPLRGSKSKDGKLENQPSIGCSLNYCKIPYSMIFMSLLMLSSLSAVKISLSILLD